ncbi:MAG: DNA-formamidopyrimidine glycosylase [Candidatus Cloacimonetes bacterium]|nr:DNA-formamidopyrimidine glycosylase [Candidatus Cloacimonadota bacterium]
MPELPEVETIVRELRGSIIGKSIWKVEELRQDTIFYDQVTPTRCLGKIVELDRRGKYIIVKTDKGYVVIIHLRMTGKLILNGQKDPITKHTRAILYFKDHTRILFDDTRTFGTIRIISCDKIGQLFCNLGCEPFSADFNVEHITKLLSKKKTAVKNFLLDQSYIAGLGNIYVNEILHESRIKPNRLTNTLNKTEIDLLVTNTRNILREAIKHNGTTISDYRRVDDKKGTFQNFLKIYGKEFCHKGHPVTRIKSNGRSTFYCEECLKENHN